jgi:hypothetical protein
VTPLIIDNATRDRIVEVMAFARDNMRTKKHPFSPGDLDAVVIPMGFRAVYSLDGGVPPVKHLSVSVAATNHRTVPTRAAMMMIAAEFGFTDRATYGTLPTDPDWVIHVLEPLRVTAWTYCPECGYDGDLPCSLHHTAKE